MVKDYYKILGISEFDSKDNIKHAYRKLARQYHPDVAGNTADAINMFKEINEAYSILSDSIKKAEYDKARHFYNYAKQSGQNTTNTATNPNRDTKQNKTQSSETKNFTFNWEDFIFGKKKEHDSHKQQNNIPENGSNIYSDIEITQMEAVNGCIKVINMLQTQTCPKCNGRKFANGGTCPHCNGKGEFTSYKKFNVKIPANIHNNSKIRLAGEGNKGINGGKNGDLYFTIHIKENSDYKIEGLNVIKKVAIAPYEAILGTSVTINTADNTKISLKIAPYTQNGQKIRLAKCGLVQNNTIGDMIIIVDIKIPNVLTEEEILLYKNLEQLARTNHSEEHYDR